MCAGMCRVWLESGASRASVRAASSASVRVLRIVVVVQQVVQRARMFRVRAQHAVRGSSPRASGSRCRRAPALWPSCASAVPDQAARHRPEQRQRVERRRRPDRPGTGAYSRPIASAYCRRRARRVALAERATRPRSSSPCSFGSLRPARAGRLPSARGGPAPARPAWTSSLSPERLVIGHRLAPVSHDEAGIEPARLPKRVVGVFVLERVQRCHAALEAGPRLARSVDERRRTRSGCRQL